MKVLVSPPRRQTRAEHVRWLSKSRRRETIKHMFDPSSQREDTRVIRVGNTVHRETGSWTPAVHDLLAFLASRDFAYSPRVLGFDTENREILSYLDGFSGADGWAPVVGEQGLTSFARLLRVYHDTVKDFTPKPGAVWAYGAVTPRDGDIICHGDFGPWNGVWRGKEATGLLDWDFAYPGPAMDDVAYALAYTAPFRDDETCLRWLRYDMTPDREHRIELFADAYGLTTTAGLVDAVIERQRLDVRHAQVIAEQGVTSRPGWPLTAELERRVAWSEENRGLFE